MSLLGYFKKERLPAHLQKGEEGEKTAAKYLHRKGWRILEKNYQSQSGEIDIIADDHGELVFVEVRLRKVSTHGTAEQTVDQRKQKHVEKTAEDYLRNWRCPELKIRFDIVTIETFEDNSPLKIQHFKSAF